MGLSPMMGHYLQVKEKYPDCVLFYRLGDFYEMFFDDAIKVSALLDLTLTGKDCGLDNRAPMCGIPYHAADVYISKLVSLGEKVAICEQLSEPNKNSLVVRDVVRVVTNGTIINDELIDEKTNNFLSSVCKINNVYSVAWADITTGEFFVKSIKGENSLSALVDLLVRINPAEIISDNSTFELFKDMPIVKHGVLPEFNLFLDGEYDYINASNNLKRQFNVASLSSYGFLDDSEVCASGALVAYLIQTQKKSLININNIKVENDGDYMMLDSSAVRNLELVKTLRDGKRHGSLLWLLDKTKTSMGARKLQNYILTPLKDKDKILYRQQAVKAFFDNTPIRMSLTEILSSVKDVGRLTGKISNGNLMPKDCIALSRSLENIPTIKFNLLGIQSKFVCDISDNLKDFSDLVSLLNSAIQDPSSTEKPDSEYIKAGYNEELDKYRSLCKNSKDLISKMESREREKTGIKNLKIGYNRVFGYYIEVTNSFKELVPFDYKRRQTIANAERYVTEELSNLESEILTSEEKFLNLELKIYDSVKGILFDRINDLKLTSDALSDLDVILSLSTVAKENNYVIPEILESDGRLNIVEGRHPVVEKISHQRFISNDALLDNSDNRTIILTGPNMAGKSTYMRQVALIVLMAHLGSFVPASSAEIPITDKIFTRIGASDSLISDQSTFMVEMTEVAEILNNATKNSLIILDEIGRGTSTFDGLSIAWAVVEHITNNIKAKTMFATHYHELTDLEGKLDGVKNYKVSVKELSSGIVFLRKIMRGGTNRSFGIEVAELAGVNKKVTLRAREILKSLENKEIAFNENNSDERVKEKSETERIIEEIDINNLSPMKAFEIIADLQDKMKENV